MKPRYVLTALATLGLFIACSGCSIIFPGEKLIPPTLNPTATRIIAKQSTKPSTSIDELIAQGDAQRFEMFVQNDPTFQNMEVYRTMLPQGWTAQGSVDWNYASAMAPAFYTLTATSPDQKATAQILSEQYFGIDYWNGEQYDQGYNALILPRRAPMTSSEVAVAMFTAVEGFSVTSVTDLGQNGEYENSQKPYIDAIRAELSTLGMNFEGWFATIDAVRATGTYNGVQQEFYIEIPLIGYTTSLTTSLITSTSTTWAIDIVKAYFAPVGTLDGYISDARSVTANFVANDNWNAARTAMGSEISTMVRNKQLADWSAARQLSNQLSARVDAIIDHTNAWIESTDRAMNLDRFSDYMFDRNTYDIGDGGVVKVDTKYDYVWMDNGGNVIGTNSSLFNPNVDAGGSSYRQLEPIR